MSSTKPKARSGPKSRRRPKPKAKELDKSWSMYPELHDSVDCLLEEDDLFFTFFAIDEDTGSIKEYDTNIMGRFKCSNRACPKSGWGSKRIAITIRMYSEQQYNARVYHQRCKCCGSLSQPFPGDTYAERIAYRLKKWSGKDTDQPHFFRAKSQRPHERTLCEGCKHGHCKSNE
ncbi:zinc-binding domain-containing protein [Tricladium varicosporioides]|nr:zinc-binding domain-containing protein [Hymenoscyphus varicosporioides]